MSRVPAATLASSERSPSRIRNLQPCRRCGEPEPVVERDRGATRVRRRLPGRRQSGERCQRDERDAHYAMMLKVAFSPLTVTTTW